MKNRINRPLAGIGRGPGWRAQLINVKKRDGTTEVVLDDDDEDYRRPGPKRKRSFKSDDDGRTVGNFCSVDEHPEILDMIQTLENNSEVLSDWEANFCSSIKEWTEKRRGLTAKQYNALQGAVERIPYRHGG